MIDPFEPAQVRPAALSYGLSSYGYDVRLAEEFLVPVGEELLDPKAVGAQDFERVHGETYDLAGQSYVLGRTVEYLHIPVHVLTLCVGKSSYARCGLVVNVTPFEPGWEGYATLCLVNTGRRPLRLYAGEGIAQVLFLESDEVCEVSYAQREGKYQAQQETTPARPGQGPREGAP